MRCSFYFAWKMSMIICTESVNNSNKLSQQILYFVSFWF